MLDCLGEKTLEPLIIDAANLILGRVAGYAAKRALEGEEVIIVNIENAVISGAKESVVEEAKRSLKTRTLASLKKSPVHPRRPDTYARRVIRGMLPWKKPKGREAYRRVKVYIGLPKEFADKPKQRIPEAEAYKLRCPYISLKELCREIGGA
jgi:large subunit ribosomal protein L13